MIDYVPIPWESLTPAGLYMVLMVLFMTGRVAPISRVRDEQKTTEYWRGVSDRKDATIATQAETIQILSKDVGETVAKVMGELQQRAGVRSDEVDAP